jgi:hypothetical protein
MTADKNILDAKDFTFAAYNPGIGSDSGALQLAVSKTDKQLQYVIKSASPELACNEFMYHKIAAALGLHTQEVKLFRGVRGSKYAAGIRYSPDAKEFDYQTATERNRRDFCAFHALYVILNEEDSQEFYINGSGRVFKLDNAAAFNLSPMIALQALDNPETLTGAFGEKLNEMIQSSLHFVEYDKYDIIRRVLIEKFGAETESACLDMYERFAGLDETVLDEAYDSLELIYPEWLFSYYCEFILIRQTKCRKYLSERGR